jgi:hypothetical protein
LLFTGLFPILPPLPLIDKLAKGDPSAVEGIPLVGRIAYNRGMGGADKFQDRALQNKLKKKRAAEKESEDEDVLERRKERRRERLRDRAEQEGVKP